MIAKLPKTADIDTIMYRIYVVNKIRRGREAAKRDETVSTEDLKREMGLWRSVSGWEKST